VDGWPLITGSAAAPLHEPLGADASGNEASRPPRTAITPTEVADLLAQVRAGEDAGRRLVESPGVGDEDAAAALAAGRLAVEQLVVEHLGLVEEVARQRWRPGLPQRGVEFDDLVGYGRLGLVRSVSRSDGVSAAAFAVHARRSIEGAIESGVAEAARLIRLPRRARHDLERLLEIARVHAQASGTEPTTEQLAVASGLPRTDVEQLLALRDDTVLVDGAPPCDAEPWQQLPGPSGAEPPVEHLAAVRTLPPAMRQLLDGLPEIEAAVLRLRFGVPRGRPLGLDEVAARTHLTPARVRQLEASALQRLVGPARSAELQLFTGEVA